MQSAITVFAQFLSLVPKSIFVKLSQRHNPERSPRTFSPWSHFVHLLHAQLAGCKSLRDGIMSMNAASNRLYHLGVKPVPRSTFADANNKRPCAIFEALFGELYTRCLSQAPKHKFSFENKLFSLDASVIDLCLTLFPWAKFRTAKGGIKVHTVIDHDGYLPAVVTVTEARCHEVNIAKLIKLPKGSIVVFDRGYIDYTWFRQLCKTDVFLVTRLKSNARFRIIERHRTDRATGVTSDHIIHVADGVKGGEKVYRLAGAKVYHPLSEKGPRGALSVGLISRFFTLGKALDFVRYPQEMVFEPDEASFCFG